MPQLNEKLCFDNEVLVSDMDYSEARNILDITTNKQKQLRRQRSPKLRTQLLLKRTYTHVCDLLNTECTVKQSQPLKTIDTNKRKMSTNTCEHPSKRRKSKNPIDDDILQFLRELNSVKLPNSDYIEFSSTIEHVMPIEVVV